MRRLSRETSFFHRSCYQDYTNKTNLSRLEKERDHSDVAAVGEDDEAEHEEQYELPKKTTYSHVRTADRFGQLPHLPREKEDCRK